MADSLTTELSLNIKAAYTQDLDLQNTLDRLNHTISDSLASGTAAEHADYSFHDTRTLAATSEDLDLAGGISNAFGTALTFVKIRCLMIHNKNTTSGHDLAVGGAAANQFINWVSAADDEVVIGPNGILFLWNPADGYAVTAGTGDLLKIDAGANTVTYDIIVIGTSA